MSAVAAIGHPDEVDGLALAGVAVHRAVDPVQAVAAWAGLGPDVGLVVLDAVAASALEDRTGDRPETLVVVLP